MRICANPTLDGAHSGRNIKYTRSAQYGLTDFSREIAVCFVMQIYVIVAAARILEKKISLHSPPSLPPSQAVGGIFSIYCTVPLFRTINTYMCDSFVLFALFYLAHK